MAQIYDFTHGDCIDYASLISLKGKLLYEDFDTALYWNTEDFENADLQILQNFETTIVFKSRAERFAFLADLTEGLNTFQFINTRSLMVVREFHLFHSPAKSKYNVVPVLVLSKNSTYTEADICRSRKKITVAMRLAQGFYGHVLYTHKFRRRSFRLYDHGVVVIRLDLTTEEIAEMEDEPLWEHLAKFIRADKTVWNDRHKYVTFVSAPWKISEGTHLSKAGLAAGGLAMFSFRSSVVWPTNVEEVLTTFCDTTPVDRPDLILAAYQFGEFERTVRWLYSASIGGLIHELGHIFDLGHTNIGFMGPHFWRMDKYFVPGMVPCPSEIGKQTFNPLINDFMIPVSSTTLLFYHKWFQPSTKGGGGDILEPGPSGRKEKKTDKKSGPTAEIGSRVISDYPIVALEVREIDSGMVLTGETFSPQAKTMEYQLSKNDVPMYCISGRAQLIVEDARGNLLRTKLFRDALPHYFTKFRRIPRNTTDPVPSYLE